MSQNEEVLLLYPVSEAFLQAVQEKIVSIVFRKFR
nr:MAG TPA: hypothetical protein [Caudoviricetes sp.]